MVILTALCNSRCVILANSNVAFGIRFEVLLHWTIRFADNLVYDMIFMLYQHKVYHQFTIFDTLEDRMRFGNAALKSKLLAYTAITFHYL